MDRAVNKITENSKTCSEISMKQFLDFLRTAYQVADTVEDTLAQEEGTSDVINWIKLKNTEFVNDNTSNNSSQTQSDLSNNNVMRQKLDEVLSEGLLDSVLPYLVPNTTTKQKTATKLSEKSSSSSQKTQSRDSLGRRRSSDSVTTTKHLNKMDSEVEIHVCDEVKNVKRDFICSQKLLVEKMGYFADVTAGQKLEDMDISVHCDIGIFEWLMRWVKKDLTPKDDWPQLNAQCVVPILVSAAFLQMEPLLQDCLFFCHENMNEILTSATNFNCLNDVILTRLAAMYTNSELEQIKDKKDKIQSKLYCKLIMSLCDPVCESVRGHWNSLCYMYRCQKCEQLIMPDFARALPCHPSCMALDRYGQVLSAHVRDPSWNINEYILNLHSKLKTWRKVYWHLWGDCHFLFCSICELPFPAHKIKWCSYHPEDAQYFTIDTQKAPLPVGRYPCCGERAYRFELLSKYSGCQFKEHFPKKIQARDAAIYHILDKFRELIELEPPRLVFPERLTRLIGKDPETKDGKLLCKEVFWWEGIQIRPPRFNLGLLGISCSAISSGKSPQIPQTSLNNSQSPDLTPLSTDNSSSDSDSTSSSSEDEQSEEEVRNPPSRSARQKALRKKSSGRLWQLNLSARSNQDLQRANEEKLLSKMVQFLSKKGSLETPARQKGHPRHVTPSGGIYVRLEHDWKENHNNCSALKRLYTNNKHKIKASRLV